MTQNRYYSNTAQATKLTTPTMTSSSTSLSLATTSGWPSIFPFVARIEPRTSNEEAVLITSGAGSTASPYVITRGYDGTVAVSHTSGVTVEHGYVEKDFSEPQQHLNLTGSASAAHGLPSTAFGGGNTQLIQQLTAATTTASFTFSSIPQTFNHLMLMYLIKGTSTTTPATSSFLELQWNGLTSGYNYLAPQVFIGGSTVAVPSASSQSSTNLGNVWNSSGSNTAGSGVGYALIPFYSTTVFNKQFVGYTGATDGDGAGVVGTYTGANITNSNAITSLTATLNSGSFVTGSSVSLYGVI